MTKHCEVEGYGRKHSCHILNTHCLNDTEINTPVKVSLLQARFEPCNDISAESSALIHLQPNDSKF
jgi:hypothetical protein